MEDRGSEWLVAPGEWYAAFALPGCPVAADLPDVLHLGRWFAATRRLPVPLSRRCRGWLGKDRVERLETAGLFLLSTAVSTPKLSNRACEHSLEALYLGLLLSGSLETEDRPLRLYGSRRRRVVEIISAGEMEQPRRTLGAPSEDVTPARLRVAYGIAKRYSPTSMKLEGLWPIEAAARAFLSGIVSRDPDARLHQFVRCIEAFAFPAERATRREFERRTELFVGPAHADVMGELYGLRRQVEHLHNPLGKRTRGGESEARIHFLLRTVQAEAIARYCLRTFLPSPELPRQFREGAFWDQPDAERRRLWGDALDLDAVTASLEREGLGRYYIGM